MTSDILSGTDTGRNNIFMSKGNTFTTLEYKPYVNSESPYVLFVPVNIAEHFRNIGKPVPEGFDRFNAVLAIFEGAVI